MSVQTVRTTDHAWKTVRRPHGSARWTLRRLDPTGGRVAPGVLHFVRPRCGSSRARANLKNPQKEFTPNPQTPEQEEIVTDDDEKVRRQLERLAHSDATSGRGLIAKTTALRAL